MITENDNSNERDRESKKTLITKFVNAESTEKLHETTKDISKEDDDIDKEAMEKADKKFQAEKQQEKRIDDKNDADFKQLEKN